MVEWFLMLWGKNEKLDITLFLTQKNQLFSTI